MGASGRGSLSPDAWTIAEEKRARKDYPWAVELVAKRFGEGLERVFERVFVDNRFGRFALRADPVYVTLLEGMNDEGVARTMVGNWMIAHTLATQTRFWLEDAIVDLLYAKCAKTENPKLRPHIYSLSMLGDGWLAASKSIWEIGEKWREQIHGRGAWRPLIHESAVAECDAIAGEEERRFDALPPGTRAYGCSLSPKEDDAAFARVASAIKGDRRPTLVRCNLLFINPATATTVEQVWAIRYINPTTFGQSATVKAERVNLLRLSAYLAGEKPARKASQVRIVAADLLPRRTGDGSGRSTAHFSARTRWSSEQLWAFLDVPFNAVTAGIREAGKAAADRLRTEISRI